MYRQNLKHLSSYMIILGMIISCHPSRRPIAVLKKQPKLNVMLSGMNELGDPNLKYHLTGCTEAEGQLQTQASAVVFSSRALKKGLGGCIVTVTAVDAPSTYEYKRGAGILWISDEFSISIDESGLMTSQANMEKAYKNTETPENELFSLKVLLSLPPATDTSKFTSYTGSLVCSNPIGPLHKNAGIKFDQKLTAILSFADQQLPADLDTVTCTEISIVAKLGDKEIKFMKDISNLDNSVVPSASTISSLNHGKPYQLELVTPTSPDVGGGDSSLAVQINSCPRTEYLDLETGLCTPCPGGMEYREVAGACVVSAN